MDDAEMQKVLAALNINVPRLSVLRSMLERISGDPIPNDEALRLCVLAATDSSNQQGIVDWYRRSCIRSGKPIMDS